MQKLICGGSAALLSFFCVSPRAHISIEESNNRRGQSDFRWLRHIGGLLCRFQTGAKKEDVSLKTSPVGRQRPGVRRSGRVSGDRSRPETKPPAWVQWELQPVLPEEPRHSTSENCGSGVKSGVSTCSASRLCRPNPSAAAVQCISGFL